MSEQGKIIGIDLGTTNSVLGVIQDGKTRLVSIGGERLLPSVVGTAPTGEILVGSPARNQWVVAPERTIRSIKRKMGSGETVTMAGTSYTPQEISACILREIRRGAEHAMGQAVQRAVITVPAYFNEVQRQATMEAGAIAGLAVERILNEPTAAALAYGYGLSSDEHLRVLVYDLGEGRSMSHSSNCTLVLWTCSRRLATITWAVMTLTNGWPIWSPTNLRRNTPLTCVRTIRPGRACCERLRTSRLPCLTRPTRR